MTDAWKPELVQRTIFGSPKIVLYVNFICLLGSTVKEARIHYQLTPVELQTYPTSWGTYTNTLFFNCVPLKCILH